MLKEFIRDVSKNAISHGGLPFWSWNDRLEEDELRRQIRNMHELEMNGFFMHARGGLETEYMSDEWHRAIEVCIDEARRLGMEAWAYDENGWPSGFAGGKLLDDPENFIRHLIFTKTEHFPKEDHLAVDLLEGNVPRRVTAPEEGAEAYYVVTEGVSDSYVDVLDKTVVRKFIDATHEEYKKHDTYDLKGFFTDEPQYQRWGFPYTKMIPKYFSEVYGEDVLDGLGLLFVEKRGYEKDILRKLPLGFEP